MKGTHGKSQSDIARYVTAFFARIHTKCINDINKVCMCVHLVHPRCSTCGIVCNAGGIALVAQRVNTNIVVKKDTRHTNYVICLILFRFQMSGCVGKHKHCGLRACLSYSTDMQEKYYRVCRMYWSCCIPQQQPSWWWKQIKNYRDFWIYSCHFR